MKSLQLTKFYPPVRGGIESVSYELVNGLNRSGIRTDVLCAHTALQTIRETGPCGESITRVASFGRWLSTSIAPALIKELRRIQDSYDVIHVQLPDPMSNLALWISRPKAKIVLHWQSDIVNQRRALKLYEPLQRWMLERADAIIASSEPYARSSPWLKEFSGKVSAIPLGIQDPVGVSPVAVQEVRDRYRGRKIVFALGRMTYYKGFDVLIEAARHLPDDGMVVIGGGGDLLEVFRSRVREQGLEHRVDLLGPLDAEEARAHFQACDVFCLPSIVRAEAFGVVLLEAMAASRPVVTTDIPGSGVPWVNEHEVTGFNVPPSEPLPLAHALIRILGDDALRNVQGAAARQRFLRVFTAEAMVESTARLYRGLLKAQPARRVTTAA